MLDLVALRDPQRGLDKLDRKWYSVNNGGECAAAPDPSKDAQKWPAARRGTKTPPGHASSLLVAPRPIYGASQLPVLACWPTLETGATASPGQQLGPAPGPTLGAQLRAEPAT